MPLQSTSGAASYDAFGGGVAAVPKYIEDYFSTFLYSGTGAAQTITNNIDLSTKGGLVWLKARNDTRNNWLYDTVRGKEYGLRSDLNFAENYSTNSITAFNNNGFSIGDSGNINTSGNNLVSWSWAKAPKFFDVVTYTGTGSPVTVNHNLGSTPGCIIIKATSNAQNWHVWHRSAVDIYGNGYLILNSTAAVAGGPLIDSVSSTNFVVSSGASDVGYTYVCYVFAHNAGGFGLTGTDNVISCGSYGSNTTDVNLGYEPQWIMIKNTTSGIAYAGWAVFDNMRGLSMVSTSNPALLANSSTAEYGTYNGAEDYLTPTATGFKLGAGTTLVGGAGSSGTWIYIAIRRGPMKVPTSGTSVFAPVNQAGGGTVTTNFPVDLNINTAKSLTIDKYAFSRLTGPANYLNTNLAAAETAGGANFILFDRQTSIEDDFWGSGNSIIYWNFRRAPSFFDEVCYTGTEISGQTFNHNLGVVPEMMIVKARDGTTDWTVYHSALGASARIYLNATNAANTGTAAPWNSTTPTSTVFSLGNAGATNLSGTKFVNYLFATCAGVSKVGSYTGTATTKQIDCGFTGGAGFVLIKRTDSTGSWYVWDSSRGIVSGNDPYLLLNSTAAEVTNTDYIDTYSAGFEISSTAPAEINASGGSFIFLAIS